MREDTGDGAAPPDDDHAVHDRRYKLFAIGLAVIVLALFGLLILIASGILSRAAGKAKAVIS